MKTIPRKVQNKSLLWANFGIPGILILNFSFAQEMPDTIWGFVGNDTVSLALHKGFSGGWSVRLFYKFTEWRELTRETLWIDTTPRILRWTQYCQPPFQRPCRRVLFTYLEGRLYYTAYQYNETTLEPLWRSYAWGSFPTTTDPFLSGMAAEALWPAFPDTLHPAWPFPRRWRRAHWPDSSRTEAFDPIYQVFVEAAGMNRTSIAAACDSTQQYEGAFFFPIVEGRGLLCFPDGERLALSQDSLCDSTSCWLTQRTLGYSNGLPTSDTLLFRQSVRAGPMIASTQLITHYRYDAATRLVEVLAPNRRYRLSYSGQILALPPHPPCKPLIQYSSAARWVRLQNLSYPTTLYLYDLMGNLLFSATTSTDCLYTIPPALQGPCLLQIRSSSGFFWQRLIALP